jgi:signal transduction histidine kinase
MMLRGERTRPWLRAYEADRDQLLLGRVRTMVGLALPPVVLLTAYMMAADPGSAGFRTRLGSYFALVLVGGWALTALPVARRHALPTAIIAVLGLVAVASASWGSTPFDVEVAPLNALALILASTLLFPWGPAPQGIVCLAVIFGYVTAIGPNPGTNQGYAMGALSCLTPVAMFGAHLIDGWRRGSFQRAWEQSKLVALATALSETLEGEQILAQALRHGGDMVGADARTALLFDAGADTFRIAAEQDMRPGDQSWLGVEFPATLDVAVALREREVVVLPRDRPDSPVIRILEQGGVAECVYVLMRHAGATLGALTFSRFHAVSFTEAECRLIRALAHQTAQALRNAELVAALRQANALKSEFVSTMSHELRTPLNVIIGFTEMLGDDDLPTVDRRDCLERMDAAARDLLGLIESTLEIGRLEADRNVVRLEPIDLGSYWAELAAACGRLPRGSEVALRWSVVDAGVRVDTDIRKLTVIVRNLVGNALKFTSQGAVDVALEVLADGIVVRVSDTGIGIATADHAVVFDMFRQADGSDARQFGGSGLGLYIVSRFTAQLGGTVELQSAPGEGSRFTVRLPAAVNATRAEAA